MSTTRSRKVTAVRTVRSSRSQSMSPSVPRCAARFTEPRLQTAVSPSSVTSRISVHRFEECTTLPGSAVWFAVRLAASLNVIQPLPVCARVRIMRAYRTRAGICFTARPAASAARYAASNSSPYRSTSSGASTGENSDQSASASTRRMNSSGIQCARLRLWVRRASSPVLSRSSRNSSMSACHVSR